MWRVKSVFTMWLGGSGMHERQPVSGHPSPAALQPRGGAEQCEVNAWGRLTVYSYLPYTLEARHELCRGISKGAVRLFGTENSGPSRRTV
jgi:hypothetical protein